MLGQDEATSSLMLKLPQQFLAVGVFSQYVRFSSGPWTGAEAARDISPVRRTAMELESLIFSVNLGLEAEKPRTGTDSDGCLSTDSAPFSRFYSRCLLSFHLDGVHRILRRGT